MKTLSDELLQILQLCTDVRLGLRLRVAAKQAVVLEQHNQALMARLRSIQHVAADNEVAGIECETPRGEVVHVQFRKEPCDAA